MRHAASEVTEALQFGAATISHLSGWRWLWTMCVVLHNILGPVLQESGSTMPRGRRTTMKRNGSTDFYAIDGEQYSQHMHTELVRNRKDKRNISMAASPEHNYASAELPTHRSTPRRRRAHEHRHGEIATTRWQISHTRARIRFLTGDAMHQRAVLSSKSHIVA